MRIARNRSSWRTFGLAFAIVLAPALMQTDGGLGCPPTGDASLELLQVAVGGQDMIAFDPQDQLYEVMLPEEPGDIVVRAVSMDAEAAVSYNVHDGCEMLVSEDLPTGGGPFTLESVPEGHSLLYIWVEAPGGRMIKYCVIFAQPEQCQ